MSFTISEQTIGISGSSGKVAYGREGDVCCHVTLPADHWILRTEREREDDPIMMALNARFGLGPSMESMPIGKDGQSIDFYRVRSPMEITLWQKETNTVGWYGCSTDMEFIVEQFKEMGKWLSSAEAQAEFNVLYEGDSAPAPTSANLSDEERREKNRKAKERAKKRKAAAKAGHVPVGMAYSA